MGRYTETKVVEFCEQCGKEGDGVCISWVRSGASEWLLTWCSVGCEREWVRHHGGSPRGAEAK